MPNKQHERYSVYSLERDAKQDPKGQLFYNGGGWTDLTHVNIIHSGVDTIRQLYRGIIKKELFEYFEEKKTKHDEIIYLFDQQWSFGCMGKNSGFRYRIQNNDIGIIILVGSYYAEADKEGAHLKIELSPQFILSRETDKIQKHLDEIATWLLEKDHKPSGVAYILLVTYKVGHQKMISEKTLEPDAELSRTTTAYQIQNLKVSVKYQSNTEKTKAIYSENPPHYKQPCIEKTTKS